MRAILMLGLVAGCGDDLVTESWTVVERAEITGVDFTDVSGIGGRVWAVGSRGDLEPGALVVIDGDDWSRIDLPAPEEEPLVFAAAEDDVWVLGASALWRWDGAEWSEVELPEDRTAGVGDVGGTGPDDVWLSVRTAAVPDVSTLYRWDGASFERYDGFDDLVAATSQTVGITVGVPCGTDDGTRWSTATDHHELGNDAGWLLRFDGVTWTLEGEAPYGGSRLACDGSDLWRRATADTDWVIHRWRDGTWHEIELQDASYSPCDIWAGGGQAWIVGDRFDSPETTYAQAWLVADDVGVATMTDRTMPEPDRGNPRMSAIWQTDPGRVFAFGSAGFVLER